MLDDLHELQITGVSRRVGHRHLGHTSTTRNSSRRVASSNRTCPDSRASGDVLEFAANDLALDAAGAAQIFSEADVNVTPELAATVTERTEGWPVGLYLAALIAKDNHDDDVLSVAGDDRYVADYLYRESLGQLPDDRCNSSCAVRQCSTNSRVHCATRCSRNPDASEQLRQLEASSMFLVPLDRRRGWYRYHALFREFLLGELRQVEPDVEMKLHLRAADWYEANGSPAIALDHLLTHERARTHAPTWRPR